MSQSDLPANRSRGFTFIELLVVMAIVGVLAIAGVYMRQDRKGAAVQGVLNEFGGFLSDARKSARGTGMQIPLISSGSGPTFAMQYAVANGPSGHYLHSAQTSATRYCVVVTDISTEPAATALGSLQTALQARQLDATNLFSAGMWTHNLGGSGLTFNSNGTVAQEGYVAIAAAEESSDAPVGIILVTASGNMLRYYRSGSGSTWVRK